MPTDAPDSGRRPPRTLVPLDDSPASTAVSPVRSPDASADDDDIVDDAVPTEVAAE